MNWASTLGSSVSCRASEGNTGKQTEDLIRAPETKSHLKLGHKLSVLLTTLAPHLDYQWTSRTRILPGRVFFERYCVDSNFLETKLHRVALATADEG